MKDVPTRAKDPEDPAGGKIVDITFPGVLLTRWFAEAQVRVWNVKPAQSVLLDPDAVFAGVRTYNQGGWCYVGRPAMHFVRPNIEVSLPPGHVFAVYVNPARLAYQWRLEVADPEDSRLPVDWTSRYDDILWRK